MFEYEMDVTDLLARWQEGDRVAADALFPVIYDELRRRARRHLRDEPSGHTLETDALVNEAYVRLVRERRGWRNRAHFYAIASRAMRRILVDHARSRRRLKHGGAWVPVSLDPELVAAGGDPAAFLALDQALMRLAEAEPRLAHLIELRYFGGLQLEEIACVQEISLAKVKRDLRYALGLLHRELGRGGRDG